MGGELRVGVDIGAVTIGLAVQRAGGLGSGTNSRPKNRDRPSARGRPGGRRRPSGQPPRRPRIPLPGERIEEVVSNFSGVPRQPPAAPRPLLVILGDLHVVCNGVFNHDVEKVIEAAGGEALPASFIDLEYINAFNAYEKYMKAKDFASLVRLKGMLAYIRHFDLQFQRAAAAVLGRTQPLIDESPLTELRKIGIPAELEGETSQNVVKIFHYLKHFHPDAFVHINPLYCCPGAVSTALFSGMEEELGVPVIHLFYDGIHSPNESLEPTIHYLKKRKGPDEKKRRDSNRWGVGG